MIRGVLWRQKETVTNGYERKDTVLNYTQTQTSEEYYFVQNKHKYSETFKSL